MASGAIVVSGNQYTYQSRILWETAINNSANSTSLTLTFQVQRIGTGESNTSAYTGSLTLYKKSNNATIGSVWNINSVKLTTNPNSWTTISSRVYTISHNQDGTAPDIYIGGEVEGTNNGVVFKYSSSNGSIPFDTIIRKATITSAPNFNNTQNPTINYSNPMGSSVSSLQVAIANSTGNTIYVPYRDVSKTGTSYTFNLTTKERQALIDAVASGTSMTIRFYIKMTIYGEDHRSSVNKTFSLTDAMPALAPTVVDMNETTIALTGDMNILVRYGSKAACSTNGTVKQGATIKSQKVVNGDVEKTNTTGVFAIDNVEYSKFVFSITDSRNSTTTATINKKDKNQFINYTRPGCRMVSELRMNPDNQTVKASIYVEGVYYYGSFGAVDNEYSLYIRYKGTGDEYSEWLPIIMEFVDDHEGWFELNGASLTEQLPYRDTYTFQARIVDKLSTVDSIEHTAHLKPIFDWSRTDFNFNVPVSIDGDVAVNGRINALELTTGNDDHNIINWGGQISNTQKVDGANITWHCRTWGDGTAECYGVWNLGNMAVSTAYGNWYESASTFNVDFPYFFFEDTPEVIHMDVMSAGGSAFVERGFGTAPSADNTGDFKICRPISGNLSQVKVSIHAIGKWLVDEDYYN